MNKYYIKTEYNKQKIIKKIEKRAFKTFKRVQREVVEK